VLYFTYCATAEIKQFRRLETEFVLLSYFSFFLSIVRQVLEILLNCPHNQTTKWKQNGFKTFRTRLETFLFTESYHDSADSAHLVTTQCL